MSRASYRSEYEYATAYRRDYPATAESDRMLVLAAYILHLVGSVAGLPSLVGLALNYLKRGRSGRLLDSHHRWMIRSFWWGLLWVIVGFLTSVIFIGWLILGLTWLWYVYRHVRGLINLANGEPMPV